MPNNRNIDKARQYAAANPDVAWSYIQSDVLNWVQEYQYVSGAANIRLIVDDILARWLALGRPRPYGLSEHIWRYLTQHDLEIWADDRGGRGDAVWAAHLDTIPAHPTARPVGGAGWPIRRPAALALRRLGDNPAGPMQITRNLAGRYGGASVAALSDAGLVARRDDSPATLEITDRGRRVYEALAAAGLGDGLDGWDWDRWRAGGVRAQVAELVAA